MLCTKTCRMKERPIKTVFRTRSNINDRAFFAKIVNGQKPLKKTQSSMFDWALNTPLPTTIIIKSVLNYFEKK